MSARRAHSGSALRLTDKDIVNKRFAITRFREGYDQDEVDNFLDEVVAEFRSLTERIRALEAENGDLARRLGTGADEPVCLDRWGKPIKVGDTVAFAVRGDLYDADPTIDSRTVVGIVGDSVQVFREADGESHRTVSAETVRTIPGSDVIRIPESN